MPDDERPWQKSGKPSGAKVLVAICAILVWIGVSAWLYWPEDEYTEFAPSQTSQP